MLDGALVFDAETGSLVQLGRTNVTIYMKHWSTKIWCFAYIFNGGQPQIWLPGDPIPEAFYLVKRFIAHNISFERALCRYILIPQYGFPPLPAFENWFCTQTAARILALPAKLENTAKILKLPQQKLDATIMKRMMKPRDPRPTEDPNQIYWNDDPKDLQTLCQYCVGDALCEMAMYQWIQHRQKTVGTSSSGFSASPMRSVESPSIENISIIS
jgi:hypothetical protein